MAKKKDVVTTVQEIRRKTRKKYSAEEKIRNVLEGCEGKMVSLRCADVKASIPTCTTSRQKSF